MENKKAFSLIELLISLIIISLIISIFIPTTTKKFKYQNSTLSSGIINCKKFDENCMLCDNKQCLLCSNQLNLIDGQYIEPKTSCEIKTCPSNCAKCDKAKCLKCLNGFGLVDKTCVSCPNNCLECNGTTCTKCKDDYSLDNGKCIKGSCIGIGNICVQRFNAGDAGGLEIPANLVELISAANGASGGGEHSREICWIGQTSADCDTKNGGYSGCNRTVCTWSAAYKICNHYGLRLPSLSEASMFAINSLSKGEDGLQLCDIGQNTKSSKCATSTRCSLEHGGECKANRIWCLRKDGKTPEQSKAWRSNGWRGGGMVYYLQNGEWKIFRNADGNGEEECTSYSASVRCVKDL